MASAFLTAASSATLDGWTDMQEKLDDLGRKSSLSYTIVFGFVGYFIIYSMCRAVICREITCMSIKNDHSLKMKWVKSQALEQ